MQRSYLAAAIAALLYSPALAGVDVRNDPRAEAEYLAIEITETLQAPTALADQIELDLASIRAAFPSLSDIRVFPRWAPGEVLIRMTRDAYDSLKENTYTGFDELFGLLGTPIVRFSGEPPFSPGISLDFDKVYHGPRLAELFADAPEVTNTWPNGTIGDGDDIIAQSDRTYTLSRGFGDCPAGCIYRMQWHFTVSDDTGVALISAAPEPSTFVYVASIIAVTCARTRRGRPISKQFVAQSQ